MATLTTITVWRTLLSFRLSFRHNLAERSGTETLLVRIGTDEGGVGFGQVIPRSYLTGETIDGALRDICDRWWPRLRGADFSREPVRKVLLPLFLEADGERLSAGYAGVDVAARMATGLFGPEEGYNGASLSAGKGRLELVGVIPATGVRKAAFLARVFRLLGYRRFKVKVGTDAEADARRVATVRRIVGKDAWLAADANAAWGWDEAMERMKGLGREFGVALVEEPLTREAAAKADFQELERMTGIAAMADESLCGTTDAQRLLEGGGPSWWNIRLAKNGGFTGVNRLAGMAREKGIRLYGGILVGETGALAAAGRHSFFATGVECGEYGFSRVFVKGDPFRGAPAGYQGYYMYPDLRTEKALTAKESAMPGEIVFSDGI